VPSGRARPCAQEVFRSLSHCTCVCVACPTVLQGEAAAVLGAMGALAQCLDLAEGCKVVPGLPPEQYFFTLWCSIAGGLVAGFVAKIEP